MSGFDVVDCYGRTCNKRARVRARATKASVSKEMHERGIDTDAVVWFHDGITRVVYWFERDLCPECDGRQYDASDAAACPACLAVRQYEAAQEDAYYRDA